MILEHTIEEAGDTIKQGIAKAGEGVGVADKFLHRNTYYVLAAGALAGLIAGLFIGRACHCRPV